MSLESDVKDIRERLIEMKKENDREKKRENITDSIQIVAILLVFFFGINTLKDLKKHI